MIEATRNEKLVKTRNRLSEENAYNGYIIVYGLYVLAICFYSMAVNVLASLEDKPNTAIPKHPMIYDRL